MIFEETKLKGAYLVRLQPNDDERGFFARSFCSREFQKHGLAASMPQSNVSFNRRRGTLRGMHYTAPPSREAKLVRCTRGAIFDVLVDLRPRSRTFCKWVSAELTRENHLALYVPERVAHGFVTLEDDCEVFYQMSEPFEPRHARGVRWDDRAFGIEWPVRNPVMSARDRTYEEFTKPARTGGADLAPRRPSAVFASASFARLRRERPQVFRIRPRRAKR